MEEEGWGWEGEEGGEDLGLEERGEGKRGSVTDGGK